MNSLDEVHGVFEKPKTRKGDELLGATFSSHTTWSGLPALFVFFAGHCEPQREAISQAVFFLA